MAQSQILEDLQLRSDIPTPIAGRMPNKILIPLQFLFSCFLEPPVNRQAAMGEIAGLWQGLLFSVPQRLHYLLGPSSYYLSQWGFFCP